MQTTGTIDKAALALQLGRAMSELRNEIRQRVQQQIKDHQINISFEMLEVLGCLWRQDGINQQEIADKTLRDKSSITYIIDNLVKRGLVKRVEDEHDRRNNRIFMTTEAKQLQDQLLPLITEIYASAAGTIDERQLQDALQMTHQMISNLDPKD
jgi:DNA-binding MarR family transcriptional regulator